MSEINAENLHFLLKAPSKEAVLQLCDSTFTSRDLHDLPPALVESTADKFTLTNSESRLLLNELRLLVKKLIFHSTTDGANFSAVFPASLHKNLSDLLRKIFTERLPAWRQQTCTDLRFFPRLVDFDWRVDVKSSSSSLSRMSIPTCLLELQVQEPAVSQRGVGGDVGGREKKNVTLEMSLQTIDSMLDGLGKIRDQLSSVAAK